MLMQQHLAHSQFIAKLVGVDKTKPVRKMKQINPMAAIDGLSYEELEELVDSDSKEAA
jgi:hypothetical protein